MVSPKKSPRRRARVSISLALAMGCALGSPAPARAATTSIVPVGDLEGMIQSWKTMARMQLIRFEDGAPRLGDDGSELLFLGDYMRRGPFGRRTVEWVTRLVDENPARVLAVLGNHDINPVSLVTMLPALELGMIPAYEASRAERGAESTLGDRVTWWARDYGVQDKLQNWWIERAARELGTSPAHARFRARITSPDAEGRPRVDEAKLEAIVPREVMAADYVAFVSPGGAGWELVEKLPMLRVRASGDQKWLVMHSGSPSMGNLGVVPGGDGRWYEKYGPGEWVERWAAALDEDFKKPDLALARRLLDEYHAAAAGSAEARAKATALLERVYLPRYGDAGWDCAQQKLTTTADSVVYPDKKEFELSSVPGLPAQEVTDRLAAAGVTMVLGGHTPVGDGVLVRLGVSEHGVVRYVLADTSYSPVEGEQKVRIRPDGSILARVTTREGLKVVVDLPSEREIAELLAAEEGSARRFRGEQMRRIGKVLEGHVVMGFAVKPGAQWAPDYENLVVMRQDGFRFSYRVVDRWAVADAVARAGGSLPYARANLDALYAEAYEGQRALLKAHGKADLDDAGLVARLAGKKVYVSSGPAASSYSRVLGHEAGARTAAYYLKEWRAWLEALPDEEAWVFLGGGTTGVERAKNEVVAAVNEARRARGATPFEVYGAITGVTRGDELDPNVDAFAATRAYYWGDYFAELLALLEAARAADPATELTIEFAGGGGIVHAQIGEALAFRARHPATRVVLTGGLNPAGKDGAIRPSATDRRIAELAGTPDGAEVEITDLSRRARRSLEL